MSRPILALAPLHPTLAPQLETVLCPSRAGHSVSRSDFRAADWQRPKIRPRPSAIQRHRLGTKCRLGPKAELKKDIEFHLPYEDASGRAALVDPPCTTSTLTAEACCEFVALCCSRMLCTYGAGVSGLVEAGCQSYHHTRNPRGCHTSCCIPFMSFHPAHLVQRAPEQPRKKRVDGVESCGGPFCTGR